MKIEKIEFDESSGRTMMINPKKNSSGIYLIFNKNLELIYIGQTMNLRNRIRDHVSKNNPGRIEWKSGDWNYSTKLRIGEACFFSFVEVEDKCEKNMLEFCLIYSFKPKYNAYCVKEKKELKGEFDKNDIV